MSTRKAYGNATATARQRGAWRADALMAASRELQPSVQTRASSGQAFACKPNPPAYVVRWLVATAVLARTVRWPFPEVKPRLSPVLIEDAPSVRSTGFGTPPDLLNPSKGLSMAKTTRASSQTSSKFVPVTDLMETAQNQQTMACRPSKRRFHTLCEVDNGERQLLPLVFVGTGTTCQITT